MSVIGLDIGGANLKAATPDGLAVSRSFEIWKAPLRLVDELRELLREFPAARQLAVTMTAELADCYESKAEGVNAVLDAVETVAEDRPVHVWRTTGGFADISTAREEPMLVAAANWHALASWAAKRFQVANGLLIDVGSTTTDIIPLSEEKPQPSGKTDGERLRSSELVYTGVRRTPLCALAASVPVENGFCPLAAEWFATTWDVYLLLGEIAESPDDYSTADGRAATVEAAHARLGRMLCSDRTEFSLEQAMTAARFLGGVQQQILSTAVERVWSQRKEPCETVILSGSGSFLAEKVAEATEVTRHGRIVRLAEEISASASEAACAFAVASLAAEGA